MEFPSLNDATRLSSTRFLITKNSRGVAPAGAIISNIEDMSHWLIALMNNGKYNGKQVLPPKVLQATLEPAIALPNAAGQTRGWWEVLNQAYGMGRWTASYRREADRVSRRRPAGFPLSDFLHA